MRRAAPVALLMALSGCDYIPGTDAHARHDAETLVRHEMREPASAQFREEQVVRFQGNRVVCGEVNGRNAFGGMSGFTRYLVYDGVANLDPGPPTPVTREAGRDVAPAEDQFLDAWRGAGCSIPSPSR